MAYGISTHGNWCGARTYPTRCRYCGHKVFYFECNCGSKVFFSELGGSWPEHRCIQLLVETYGKEFVQGGMAKQMMKHTASKLRTPIDIGYENIIRKQFERRKRNTSSWIRRIEAKPGEMMEDSAVVRDISIAVDILKKLGLPSGSPIATAFLGPLSKGLFGQITVQVGGLQDNSVESYTGFVRSDLLEKMRIERGDLVVIKLRSVKVGATGWVWVCEKLKFET